MSDKFMWVDNPTVSQVSKYNPDTLNECLMHLKYDNAKSESVKFSINKGNTDSLGFADLIDAKISTAGDSVSLKYSSAGTYSFNVPVDGYCSLVLVGAGGAASSGLNSLGFESKASGGSGAAFAGKVYLTAGVHTVTVGAFGGESSALDNTAVVAGGGGNGFVNSATFNLQGSGGAGGSVSVASNISVKDIIVNSSGVSGSFSNGGANQQGGASVYYGYGKGASTNASDGTSGYAEIVYSAQGTEGSSFVNYKAGINYPSITATDFSGETFEVSGLNSDDVSSLADGTYVKYIAADSSSELIKAPLLKQPFAPSSPTIGTVWLNTSCEPVSAQKYNGSAWEVFYKVPLGQITVSNGVVTDFKTFQFSSREVSLASAINNLYPDVVIKEYVNDDTGSWYKIYASGYVEQGGFVSLNNCEDTTVVFPIPMKTYLNGFFACTRGSGQDQYAYQLGFKDNYIVDGVRKGIAIRAVTDTQVAAWWKVCGKVA